LRSLQLAGSIAVLPLVACFTGQNTLAREWEEQLAMAPSCEVDVEKTDDEATWRQIRSRGFAICVPPTWRLTRRPSVTADPYGVGGWRDGDQSFQWRYDPGSMPRQCGVGSSGPRAGEQQWIEKIGDHEVCITLGRRIVRAYWSSGLLMGGSARDLIDIGRMLSVVRTVRLTSVTPAIPPPLVDTAASRGG
jgi:hypothetical protein